MEGTLKYKNLPGSPNKDSPILENYYKNIVLYNCRAIGNQILFGFEKFVFAKVNEIDNCKIYEYKQAVPWIVETKSMF